MKLRRLFSAFLCVVLLLNAVPVVGAAASIASGTWGDNINWMLDTDGMLTIYGVGDMKAQSVDDGEYPWNVYDNDIQSVKILEGVTSIASYAFSRSALTTVAIPEGLTSIAEGAFENCVALTSLTIPSSVTSIDENPFSGCDNLSDIIVEANNQNYSSLDGVLFDKNMKTIICYPGGKSDTTYTIPAGVTTIGDRAFKGS